MILQGILERILRGILKRILKYIYFFGVAVEDDGVRRKTTFDDEFRPAARILFRIGWHIHVQIQAGKSLTQRMDRSRGRGLHNSGIGAHSAELIEARWSAMDGIARRMHHGCRALQSSFHRTPRPSDADGSPPPEYEIWTRFFRSSSSSTPSSSSSSAVAALCNLNQRFILIN